MDKLISQHTTLPVHIISDHCEIEGGHVYVIPPGYLLEVRDRLLTLAPKEDRSISFPIDLFFRSLALQFEEHAVGIVLSGTGSDGTQGVRAIKAQGGMVVVQDPQTAAFDGMPRNASATGVVDYLLPPGNMPAVIGQYIEERRKTKVEAGNSEEDLLFEMLKEVKQQTGNDFHRYKHEILMRRVMLRLSVLKMPSLQAYLRLLKRRKEECEELSQEFLIGLTQFFRDVEPFTYLEEKIIPELFAHAENNSLRIWVPGCSTGEEAYSLAMLFHEYAQQVGGTWQIKLFATDLNEKAIQFASTGLYPESIANDVSRRRLAMHFVQTGRGYQVQKHLRDMIVFTRHNLLEDAPFNRLDLISCRNLLIYLDPGIQRKVFAVFNFGLRIEGYLMLGHIESAENYREVFRPVSPRWKIYQSIFNTQGSSKTVFPSLLPTQKTHTPQSYPFVNNLQSRRTRLLEITSEALAEELGSACLVVNEDFELLRFFGPAATRYLNVPREPGGWNLLRMVPPEMSAALATAARKALATGRKVRYPLLLVQTLAGPSRVDIAVKPYKIDSSDQYLLYILIQESDDEQLEGEARDMIEVSQDTAQRIFDLEQELQITRENLQATIEELQTTNEELLAANEELQGTNEELQSVNEELYTVNSEHQSTISELTNLNSDMHNLLNNSRIGILFLDNNLNIRRLNSIIAQEINATSYDIGRPISHFSTSLEYKHLAADVAEVLSTKSPLQREVRSSRGKWYLLRILPYYDIHEEVTGVVVALIDISELKDADYLHQMLDNLQMLESRTAEAQQALLDREQAFEQIAAIAHQQATIGHMAYVLVDLEGSFVLGAAGESLPWSHLLGYWRGDAGAPAPDPALYIPAMDTFKNARTSGKPAEREIVLQLDAQGPCWLRIQSQTFGKNLYLILLRDVSRTQRLKAQYARLYHQCSQIAAQIPECFVALIDDQQQVRFIEGSIPKPLRVGQYLSEGYSRGELQQFMPAIEQAWEGNASTRDFAQSQESYLYHFFPIYDDTNRVDAILMLAQKITDLRKVRHDLEMKVADLEQFAYSVSHDLKSPLRSITGFAQLMHKNYGAQLDDTAQEYLQYIVNNTVRMNELIQGVLTYARLGKDNLAFEIVDTNEIVRKVIDNVDALLRETHGQITCAPLPQVYGHTGHFTQLIQNLVENGLKFNHSEEKHIHISSYTRDDTYIFSVRDNGIGIEPAYQQQIFNLFKHLHAGDEYKGNGIGLAVCKRIVERMNGNIWVESQPGEGATFYISLPKEPSVSAPA
ncbi:MAG: hypothetical protein OHK0039_15130 [Bacteroidia bacterium]